MGKQILNGVEYVTATTKGFPPLIYSNDEREVGVWTDGKPLYQKTINFGALPNNSSKSVNHNISNLDYIVNVFGYAEAPGINSIPIPFVNTTSAGSQVAVVTTSLVILLRTVDDRSAYTKCYVTLQYTKTTDVAGSGKYSAVGDLMHHYSETEQVVGTWIDGKPIYEKTINVGHNYASPSSNVRALNYDISSLNVDKILGLSGIYLGNGSALPYINHTIYYSCYLYAMPSTISIRRGESLAYSDDSYVTLQYTKTTD